MKTIHKFICANYGHNEFSVPVGTKVLSADSQHGQLCVWMLVDTDRPAGRMRLWIAGTGHELPDEPNHFIGSVLQSGGMFVWHVFADAEARPIKNEITLGDLAK